MVDRCRVKLSSSTQETLFFPPLLPGRHNTAKRMKGLSKTWTVILKGFRNEQVFEGKKLLSMLLRILATHNRCHFRALPTTSIAF